MEHRIPLADGWSLWRWILLRGTGFPVAHLETLAAPRASAAARRVLSCEAHLESARQSAIAALAPLREERDAVHRKRVAKLLAKLRAGGAPGPDPLVGDRLAPLERARVELEAARAAFEATLEQECGELRGVLRGLVAEPAFREAIAWQNRRLVTDVLDAILRQAPTANDFKARQRELLVASYLQRYCAKNDTIGFFGPIGWASLAPRAPEAITQRPGPALVSRRKVFFEHWAIARLAERFADDPELCKSLKPRRAPTVRCHGTTLVHSVDQRVELPLVYARLIERCDGSSSASAIAEAMLAETEHELEEADEVYAMLAGLVERGLIAWSFDVPPQDLYPERRLRAELAATPPGPARQSALETLEALVVDKERVARAAGDPAALSSALAALEHRFTEATGGASAVRAAGAVYAGRTLLFEDTERSGEVVVSTRLLDEVAPALGLVLTAARWFTHEIAARFRSLAEATYERLRAAAPDPAEPLGYLRLFRELAPAIADCLDGATPILAAVEQELAERWRAVLAYDPSSREVTRSAAELRAAVEERFAAPMPGWPGARHVSPDLLIAAAGPEAIERGEFRWVLGEVHAHRNTLLAPVFMDFHPDSGAVARALDAELDRPRLGMVPPGGGRVNGACLAIAPRGIDIEAFATRSVRPRAQVAAIGELIVERDGPSLTVRTRDGRLSWDIIEMLENNLAAQGPQFAIAPHLAHVPRIVIDRLVVSRERWRFPPAELAFAAAPTPAARFVESQRWRAAHGLPRFVFWKVPEELKPYYLDFDSPIFVELFCRMARKTAALSVTEMLPDLASTWLTDAAGRGYASELRVVTLDPERWRPPSAT